MCEYTMQPFLSRSNTTTLLGGQLLTSISKPLVTDHTPLIGQGNSGDIHTLGGAKVSGQQVTSLSTSLSDVLYVSLPISFTGIAGGNKPTVVNQACVPCQAKGISFTAEHGKMTFDDWLLTLERTSR